MKTRTSIYRRTFAFAYVLLVAVIFCGCGSSNSEQQKEQKPLNQIQSIETGDVQVVQIDSCEYVVWNYAYAGGIVHKQNCKFCAERSKK
jgi:PBP1b-binding outer membrane lipoprotein LpoB